MPQINVTIYTRYGKMNVNRVKKLRLSLKLSQEELGERTNISQQLISKIENDDQKLTRDNMIVLADFFQVSTDYLLGRSNVRTTLEQESERLNRYEQYYDFIQVYEVLGDKGKKLLHGMADMLVKADID